LSIIDKTEKVTLLWPVPIPVGFLFALRGAVDSDFRERALLYLLLAYRTE
jgi:hypothetical protein